MEISIRGELQSCVGGKTLCRYQHCSHLGWKIEHSGHISGFVQELTETNNTDLTADDYGGDGIFLHYEEKTETETSPTLNVEEIIQDIGGSDKSTRLQQ